MIEWRGAGYQINKGHGWYEPKDPSKACRIDHGYVRISKKFGMTWAVSRIRNFSE